LVDVYWFFADDFLEVTPNELNRTVTIEDVGTGEMAVEYELTFEEYLQLLQEMQKAIKNRIKEVKWWLKKKTS